MFVCFFSIVLSCFIICFTMFDFVLFVALQVLGFPSCFTSFSLVCLHKCSHDVPLRSMALYVLMKPRWLSAQNPVPSNPIYFFKEKQKT